MDMERKTIKFFSPLKTVVFLVLAAFMGSVHAEYYLVYPAPSVACISCCNGCAKVKHYKKVTHKRYKPIKKRKIVHAKRRSSCSIAVYQPQVLPACACAGPWVGTTCSPDIMPGYWVPYPYEVSYEPVVEMPATYTRSDFSYNPDMATADDNAEYYPDMQIN